MTKKKPKKRFNWRGNRPRMGRRSMCGMCGWVITMEMKEGSTCWVCGEPAMHDISYDDLCQTGKSKT